MFYKSKEIQGLLRSIADRSMQSINSSLKLLYYLRFPREDLPKLIANTLSENEELLLNQDSIGKSLAGAHIEELSKILDEELIILEQTIIYRQVNRIALFLEEKKAPNTLNYAFKEISKHLLGIKALLKDITEDTVSYPAKEVLLLEEVLSSILIDRQLSLDFFIHSMSRIDKQKRSNLVRALEGHLTSYSSLPLADGSIVAPNSKAKLRPELTSFKGFEKASVDLKNLLISYKPEDLVF